MQNKAKEASKAATEQAIKVIANSGKADAEQMKLLEKLLKKQEDEKKEDELDEEAEKESKVEALPEIKSSNSTTKAPVILTA